ncbi:hypothetical protein JMF97_15395 [Micromonospora fiedleri]|uniref:Lipoprotein LprG n=1 Tax=Micromonospora fiedleri TaxID=1157498 RepID=A0ABS1UMS5_9ACTN|nr:MULTISPECIES: hypothetical protein [Micromonospora]MBL6277544.1 hypothetical protein [Micromonospora fiedleri]WSK42372.1 hypothetical protein OG712_28635 [Micromonospora maris]
MHPIRSASAGLALAAALSLGLTGCTTSSGQHEQPLAAPATSTTADPRADLTAALEELNKQSSRFELVSPVITGSGSLDPLNLVADMTLDLSDERTMRMVSMGDDVYLKFGGEQAGSLSDKWLYMDTSKLGDDSDLKLIADDPGNVKALIESIVTVDRTSPGKYAGTVDYTRTVDVDSELVKMFGRKAASVPFTATVDTDGRLTGLVIDLTTLDARMGKIKASYSDFGSPVTVRKPPAGEIEEAPADLIEALGG